MFTCEIRRRYSRERVTRKSKLGTRITRNVTRNTREKQFRVWRAKVRHLPVRAAARLGRGLAAPPPAAAQGGAGRRGGPGSRRDFGNRRPKVSLAALACIG